jgi:hypothetical protein
MELISSELFPAMFPEDSNKRFYLCVCDSWDSISTELQPSSKHFGLLIASDAGCVPNEVLIRVARKVYEKGLGYLCAWGPDCSRVEDIFDGVDVENELDGKTQLGSDDVLMTTSHESDSLPEAVWFFANCAWPTKYYSSDCTDWIVAIVKNSEWESTVRTKLAEIGTKSTETDES